MGDCCWNMEQDAALVRQAHRWTRQQKAGAMPDELYTALADGARGLEKRQITSLAKVSRLITKTGEIRTYNDFKKDWKYVKSVYGQRDICGLCGKKPIVENCILRDEEADREIMVGNICVYRYVEITIGGRIIADEEKKQYLKNNMKEAKHNFAHASFTKKYPSVMSDLRKYESMMTERRIFYNRNPNKKLWKSIHRNMIKRMISHGYPSPKLHRQWAEFILNADQNYKEYSELLEGHEEGMRLLKEKTRKRNVEMAQKMAEMRNKWSIESKQFMSICNEMTDTLNDWQIIMAGKTASRINNTGLDRLNGGYYNFYEEMIALHSLTVESKFESESPLAHEIKLWIENNLLTNWEKSFCESILIREILKRNLTVKQEKIIEKIRNKIS